MTINLSIVVPILNEEKNIPILLDRVTSSLGEIDWEIVFVDDDSSDNSRRELIALSQSNPRVRFLTRIGRQGLSTAVIEGVLTCSSDYIAVMDGDLQHDETLLPKMLQSLTQDDADIVIGSRFLSQSSLGDFSSTRENMSRVGNWLSQTIIKTELTDPLSGFFMLKRTLFESAVRKLSGTGFKILLDILSTIERPIKIKELPFEFGTRLYGESKIDSLVTLEFGLMLLDKWFGKIIPARFLLFATVGALGVGVHVVLLALFFKGLELDFYYAQIISTLLTMSFNFSLNNNFTYRDRRLKGKAFVSGLLSFYLVCSIGAVANFQFAEFLYQNSFYWVIAGIAGAAIGAVWNYAMTSLFTWKAKRK